jgi:hypothetical protein
MKTNECIEGRAGEPGELYLYLVLTIVSKGSRARDRNSSTDYTWAGHGETGEIRLPIERALQSVGLETGSAKTALL